MTNLIEIIDSSHILVKISKIPRSLIIEIIIILVSINLLFATIYYNFYLYESKSFKNIHNMESTKPLTFYDFFYFSCTTFYSLGYDVVPQTNSVKTICIFQLMLSFLITTIFIAQIINH